MARTKKSPDTAQETATDGHDVFDDAIAAHQAEAAPTALPLQEAVAQQEQPYIANPSSTPREPHNGHAAAHHKPSKPLPVVHGSWRDNEVGVRREEDFKNKLTTILFRDKPPAKAQEMLAGYGFQRENDRVYSKPIEYLRRREMREEADNLLLDVDNVIREEKGLQKRESFYISRS